MSFNNFDAVSTKNNMELAFLENITYKREDAKLFLF